MLLSCGNSNGFGPFECPVHLHTPKVFFIILEHKSLTDIRNVQTQYIYLSHGISYLIRIKVLNWLTNIQLTNI